MFKQFADTINMPEWAPRDSRYWKLYMNDLWLQGEFYDHLEYGFWNETNKSGQINKMYEKAPSIRLNLPALSADVSGRMLFAGDRSPRLAHDADPVKKAMKWMVRKGRLLYQYLATSFRGQAGSVALTFKVVNGWPCVNIWNGRHCWPTFDDAEQLKMLMLCYPVFGAQFLGMDPAPRQDAEGNDIVPDEYYWYIRIFDDTNIITCLPIRYENWNPVDGNRSLIKFSKENVKPHNAGEIPALWIPNLPGGDDCDGRSTFGGILDNCVHLDYTLSQLGRGINYCAAPQLMVKGRILNYERGGMHMLGPQSMLNLPADRKTGDTEVKGAEAKMLEITGDGIGVGMEKWAERIKQWTQEIASVSRKDPNTINGAMSGKAMELIDEDFVNLVKVLKLPYGEYGYLEGAQKLARMCIRARDLKGEKIKVFASVTEELIEEIELDWPKMYEATPEEVQYLCTALANAIKGGIFDQEEARVYLQSQIDLRGHGFDAQKVPDLKSISEATGALKIEEPQTSKPKGAAAAKK